MMDAPLRLMLVDEDPVFRLGLRIWLEQSAGYEVVAEASQTQDALAILTRRAADRAASTEGQPASQPAAPGPSDLDLDLVVLDLGMGTSNPSQLPGLQLCGAIKQQFPSLPVLVLSARSEPILTAAAQQMGADGVGSRSMPVAELGALIQQLGRPAPPNPTLSPLRSGHQASVRVVQRPATAAPSTPPPGRLRPMPWSSLRRNLRQSSLQQIEAVMATIEAEQRRGRADVWTEAVLAGRYRELMAARWLMQTLLATPSLDQTQWAASAGTRRPERRRDARHNSGSNYGRDRNLSRNWPSELSTGEPDIASRSAQNNAQRNPDPLATRPGDRLGALPAGDWVTRLFERIFRKLQGSLDNTSDIPLETDILREDKKRELLYLTLRKFEDALDHLRQAEVLPGQLADQSPLVLQDVWEATLTDFFGRYYTLQLTNLEQPVVPTLVAEAEVVRRSILDRIPQVPMLLGHLLFQEPIVVDGGSYLAATPQAQARSQALLENLLIQLANAVIQPLLNCFADVELMKKNLYHRRIMTSRDIERFRNDLSWRYRWDGLINEPRAIFESEYSLLGFTERGIQRQSIYAPRRHELDHLSGLQRLVTLTIEARDAVAPRFRSAVSLVGSSLVYVLTDVIGRGIGLIGRGILRGVGSAWRDPRYRPSSSDYGRRSDYEDYDDSDYDSSDYRRSGYADSGGSDDNLNDDRDRPSNRAPN